ncbi:Endonuclease/exonuclease/phosphatase [Trichoderma camerunense]
MSSPSIEQTEGSGPDGTSIRPVSSLLARFENMNKAGPSQPQSQPASASAPAPQSRNVSPGPKPDRLRNLKTSSDATPTPISPITPAKPSILKDRAFVTASPANRDRGAPIPPPPLSTRPPPVATKPPVSIHPPAVTVQPPLSPPKGGALNIAPGEQSPFLDPVTISSATSSRSPTPLRIPSRPLTPTGNGGISGTATPRSPKQGISKAPSPPPPRRSAELKREKEFKPAPPPPPASRSERTLMRAATGVETRGRPATKRPSRSQESSPFGEARIPEKVEENPPELPVRPKLPQQNDAPSRTKQIAGAFEQPTQPTQPTIRPSLSVRKPAREGEPNGLARAPITPQITGSARPALPARPQTTDIPPQPVANNGMKPPPKPPRPSGPNNAPVATASVPVSQPPASNTNRVVSNPSAQQLSLKAHGRSMTMMELGAADHLASDVRAPPAPTATAAVKHFPMPVANEGAVGGVVPKSDPPAQITAYPDSSSTNRRPPFIKKGCYEIQPKYDPRLFDVCGQYVCTTGPLTRVWSLLDGEQIVSLAHTEGVKATAVSFKPSADPDQEGSKVWIGTNLGEIMEVEIPTQRILICKAGIHGKSEVTKIYRHLNEMWTVDEGGNFHVWGPDSDGEPNLNNHPHQTYKVPKGETFSMVVGDELWQATGKQLRIFAPTRDNRTAFQVLARPITVEGAGDITSGTLMKGFPGKVFLGHVDGKISIFSTSDYSCKTIVNISTWKINTLAGVGQYMWAGYNTGKVCVYDVAQTPWVVLKEWQAHDSTVLKMKVDFASAYQLDQLQVVSLGADSRIKVWDGMLQDDWLEDEMKSKDTTYCDFDEIKALIFTWNAGASTPHSLRYSDGDATFFQDLLQSSGSPDILVFGFQELVDLEDKKATAKRLLKSKKKEGTDQERMSHQYRDWRDFLLKTLDDYMPADHLYHLLHTAPMVGLFTCVFVKSSLRDRITHLSGAEVKRGMGGLHGNKGAVAVRFQVDDTSLCFINCHLAAGQTQASSRHNDAAAILEANLFPVERDTEIRIDTFSGGGDGSMVLDHELCILNGDLNYRIDTMSRDTVVKAVEQNNLAKLLERDQLLVARRRNPALRLRAFEELPITFAPTYKYDVGTDTYDTSEKRRSPAWCDRLLFRGRGRVQQLDYRRHEVRVSDHRPVTGDFRLWVKKIRPKERAAAWMQCQQGFEDVRQKELAEDKLHYLTQVCGYDAATSQKLIQERASRKPHRSPSRSRAGY